MGTPPAPAFTLKPPRPPPWSPASAVSLGVGDNVGGPRSPACGSLLTVASRPRPACDHGQQGSSGHCAPLPAPRPRRNSLKRDVGVLRWGRPVLLRWGHGNAVLALSATWRARPIALGARATRPRGSMRTCPGSPLGHAHGSPC